MTKNNFLLVDLNESKTKKLAETITSDTSRKILNYLVEKEDSEANISKKLGVPISTVHYHLNKLKEAGLVIVEEFHYSEKGREVNHYKLANKYIIIAPKKISGLKEKLKGILPVIFGVLGISAVIKIIQNNGFQWGTKNLAMESAPMMADAAEKSTGFVAERVVELPVMQQPDIALWFLLGGLCAIGVYVVVHIIKIKIK